MELKFQKPFNFKGSYTKWVTGIVIAGLLFTLIKDYTQTVFTDSAYYFSESFLFSTFWWWFIPLFIFQNRLLEKEKTEIKQKIILYILLVGTHFFASALLIDIASSLFYEQRYVFLKVIGFSMAENGYLLLLLYGIPFFLITKSHHEEQFTENIITLTPIVPSPTSTIIVQDGQHKVPVNKKDILHICSSPPYVQIQASTKKYLYKIALGKIQQELDAHQFVRIHKSTIVNVQQIASFRSRQNGDYDIILKDQTLLRLSRNYAAHFKQVMGDFTQDRTV